MAIYSFIFTKHLALSFGPDWFGLASLFNDILTFVGYLMLKPSWWRNIFGTILPIACVKFLLFKGI